MALEFERLYRFRDGVTQLNASNLNVRFQSVDGRLNALEVNAQDFDAAIAEIAATGLERINAVLAPAFEKVQAIEGDGIMVLAGDWDASTGAYPINPARGVFYRVSAPGSFDGKSFTPGDAILYSGAEWLHLPITNGGFNHFATGAYSALPGDRILADTTGGPFTITLPAEPVAGDSVVIMDAAGSWQSSAVTVSGNGRQILGGATAALDVSGDVVEIVYLEAGDRWIVRSLAGVQSVNGQKGNITLPAAPVQSVNGQTGAVTLPAAPVASVNGQAGAVSVSGLRTSLTAGEAITSGSPVTVAPDGRAATIETLPRFQTDIESTAIVLHSPANDCYVVFGADGEAVAVSASDLATSGTPISFAAGADITVLGAVERPSTGDIVVLYSDSTNDEVRANNITVTGLTLVPGGPQTLASGSWASTVIRGAVTYDSGENIFVAAFGDGSTNRWAIAMGINAGIMLVATLTPVDVSTYAAEYIPQVGVVAIMGRGSNGRNQLQTITMSGSTIVTRQTEEVVVASIGTGVAGFFCGMRADPTSGVLAIVQSSGSTFVTYGTASINTNGDIALSVHSILEDDRISVPSSPGGNIEYSDYLGAFVVLVGSSSSTDPAHFLIGVLDGASLDLSYRASTDPSINRDGGVIFRLAIDNGRSRVVTAGRNSSESNNAILSARSLQTFSPSTAPAFVGVAMNTAAEGEPLTVALPSAVDATRAGLIPGSLYFLLDDGSVSFAEDGNRFGVALAPDRLLLRA
ncbi:MAG: hypothetical protein AAFR84_01145 [Pseudomonadota bacterium]